VHLRSGGSELHAKPLDRLLPLLPAGFVRCHRSWIVHLAAVRALHSARGSRNWLTLQDGQEVPVGRTWLDDVKQRLG
jgi:two-component system, LytTR family, response regulator LytT